jgi:chemotaxis protein MotA
MADSKAPKAPDAKTPKVKDPNAPKKPGLKLDFGSVGGLAVALGGILGGLVLDKGKISDVTQVNAALIILGGTIGAVMVTNPFSLFVNAVKKFPSVFFDRDQPVASTIDDIITYATQARKQGIVSLEQQANTIQDPFLQKALRLAVDGIEMNEIRSIMELEIDLVEQAGEAEARVFEAAGGYSPTIGIIGAVLGLMQVMKNLANIDEVGRGIASAFVATVYGLVCANLFFLPAAAKLHGRVKESVRLREMMLDGVLSIVEGLNPKMIRIKLDAYLMQGASKPKDAVKKGKGKAATQPVAAEG